MDILCTNFIFAAFYKFEIISKENNKRTHHIPNQMLN